VKSPIWYVAIICLVASVTSEFMHFSPVLRFSLACFAIIPLASIIGRSTEAIAAHAGTRLGGLLSATFGNAVELIIGAIALKDGLTGLVKASITGSIIGNLLFVLGISFFVGGVRHPIQRFNVRAARSNASMLVLSIGVAFVMPAIFQMSSGRRSILLSGVDATVLFVLYGLGLLFALFTHKELFESIDETVQDKSSHGRLWVAICILLAATILVSVESEWLVGTVQSVGHRLGFGSLFMGVVVIAIIGNAAEHFSAVLMAWKNRMDLSLEIAIGSSLQVAMFVAPLLFGLSLVFHHPMTFVFSWPELASMVTSVLLVVVLLGDGESNWLEGALAVGAYLVLAVGFYSLGM